MKNIAKIIEFENHDVICIRDGFTEVKFYMAMNIDDGMVNPTISKDYKHKWLVDHMFGEKVKDVFIADDGAESLRSEALKMLEMGLEAVENMS